MENWNYRGRCVSTTGKRTKAGDLKMSGNFSKTTFRLQSVQYRDYPVRWITCESGIKQLVVGENQTPLALIVGEKIADLVMTDRCFDVYVQRDVFRIKDNPKEYEAVSTLRRCKHSITADFTLRLEIYAEGDFKWNFNEY